MLKINAIREHLIFKTHLLPLGQSWGEGFKINELRFYFFTPSIAGCLQGYR
jgi:hypothetical protein